MVAIAGPPGAGKSTWADNLADALKAKGESAEVLPMDGFHMDNEILIARGQLARKGIPETFDVRAFLDIVKAVRPGDQEVLVPVFGPLAGAGHRICPCRVAGPSLHHHRRQLCAVQPGQMGRAGGHVRFLDHDGPADRGAGRASLGRRWRGYKLTEEAAHAKVYENDLPNGRLILANRRPADITVDIV